jgi:CYTH domain-containing protein
MAIGGHNSKTLSSNLEIELTYLASSVPVGLKLSKHVVIVDMYFPADSQHAKLRARQKGSYFEITKKTRKDPNDAGVQFEESIELTADEFAALAKGDGRKLTKTRYYVPYKGRVAEVDVFAGSLKGLIVIEIEFDNLEDKRAFAKPGFCLADVTQEDFVAGGMLAGKMFSDIEPKLLGYGYSPLFIH